MVENQHRLPSVNSRNVNNRALSNDDDKDLTHHVTVHKFITKFHWNMAHLVSKALDNHTQGEITILNICGI